MLNSRLTEFQKVDWLFKHFFLPVFRKNSLILFKRYKVKRYGLLLKAPQEI